MATGHVLSLPVGDVVPTCLNSRLPVSGWLAMHAKMGGRDPMVQNVKKMSQNDVHSMG